MTSRYFVVLTFAFTVSCGTLAQVEAAIICYHYDPLHPYVNESGAANLLRFVSPFVQKGQLEGSFFLSSGARTYAEFEQRCNAAIPAGHSLLKMRAKVKKREYALSFPAANEEMRFNRIVVFGDSLSDEGRAVKALQKLRGNGLAKVFRGAMKLQGCRVPHLFLRFGLKPYWNGMFSNGPMWPSYLSRFLTNIAIDNASFGGATTGAKPCHPVHLGSMLERFMKVNKKPAHFANTLFVIWLGANNYFATRKERDKDARPDIAIDQIAQSVKVLCQKGARTIVLFTIPNPEPSPEWIFDDVNSKYVGRIQEQKPKWQKAVSVHNELLRLRLSSFSTSTCQVSLLDTDLLLQENQHRLKLYGVQSRLDFGYFDPVHPSTMVHCFIAGKLMANLNRSGLVGDMDIDYDSACKTIVKALDSPTSTNEKHDDL